MKKLLFVLMTLSMLLGVIGCADDSSSNSNISSNNTGNSGNSGSIINCNNTTGPQLATYGDVIKSCLPADFPIALSSEKVYYQVVTNVASADKVLSIMFMDDKLAKSKQDELKKTHEAYYGKHLADLGPINPAAGTGLELSLLFGCNDSNSGSYMGAIDSIKGTSITSMNFEFGFKGKCGQTGPIDTSYDQRNKDTWNNTLAQVLPKDYPAFVTNLNANQAVDGEYTVYLSNTQYYQIASILKKYYAGNPKDTFIFGDTVGGPSTLMATHASDTEPHTLAIIPLAITSLDSKTYDLMITIKYVNKIVQ